jgi:hypothetical protein
MRALILVLVLVAPGCSETRTIGAAADLFFDVSDGGESDQPVPLAPWVVSVEEGLESIAVDAAGNSYVTGSFENTIRFGSTVLSSEWSNGKPSCDVFVAKLDSAGRWTWAVSGGGSFFARGADVAVDAAGNCYVLGSFEDTVRLGSTVLSSKWSEGKPERDAFVAKLDSTGRWLWATAVGSDILSWGGGISADGAGNCYITGTLGEELTLGSTTLTPKGGDHEDVLVARLDSAGKWLWAVSVGGTSWDRAGQGIAVDAEGAATITGQFRGEVRFGATTLDASLGVFGDFTDLFVAKLDSTGTWRWARSLGGIGHTARGEDIAVDSAGNSYVTGRFSGEVTIGPTTLKSSVSYPDALIAKLDRTGRWLWGTSVGTETDWPTARIAVDGGGSPYVVGSFDGTTRFGSTMLSSKGAADAFVARLDSSGRWLWVASAGSVLPDEGGDIAVDAAGNGYFVGGLGGEATVGSTSLPGGGFVWRISEQGP